MSDFVEPRVRAVVAEYLGVGTEELAPEVSLVDDLAADSLDLVEVAIALEGVFDIVVPEAAIDRLRTYADLVETVEALARERREADEMAGDGARPELVWARVTPSPDGSALGSLQRAGWLTPYTAETIAEDALRAGRGARLEVMVPSSVSDSGMAVLQDQFSWLNERGVQVVIRRDHHLGSNGHRAHPHAAA